MERYPIVSVIVLNYNGASLLPACLKTLQGQNWPNLEVIVADNGSQDSSEQVAMQYGAVFHQMDKNYGFSFTNNQGAAIADGEFLLFVNNDMKFDSACVSGLMEIMLADDSIFAAHPLMLDWDGSTIQRHGYRLSKGAFFQNTLLPGLKIRGFKEHVEVVYGNGGSLMVRRKMFDEIRGFDNTFFMDYEDIDLCWRAWLNDWKSVYVPGARLYHKGVGTTFNQHQELQPLRRFSGIKNYLRFVIKTVPFWIIGLVFFREAARIMRNALIRKLPLSKIRFEAFATTVINFPDLLKARRETLGRAVTTSSVLIKKFLT